MFAGCLKDRARPLPPPASILVFILALLFSLAYFATGERIRTASAQGMSPAGSFAFLVNKTASDNKGLGILGVMSLDGAGNLTGSYTAEAGGNPAQTLTGALTGTYSSNPDGTGTLTMALDLGKTFT